LKKTGGEGGGRNVTRDLELWTMGKACTTKDFFPVTVEVSEIRRSTPFITD